MAEGLDAGAGAPFFLATDHGVCVVRPQPTDDHAIAKAWGIFDAREDAAWGAAAAVIEKNLVRAKSIANPMIVDSWRDVIRVATKDTLVFCSAPPGVNGGVELAAALMKSEAPWCAVLPRDHETLTAFATGCMWTVDELPDAVIASSFEPAAGARIVKKIGVPYTSDLPATPTRAMRIAKFDASGEQRFVLGIVLEPETVDSQGDIYSADEVRLAAHVWMEDFQNLGHQHRVLVNSGVHPVESYIAPVDMNVGGQMVKSGTWLLGVHVVNDAIWDQVKTGQLTGFSIGGYAQKVPAQVVAGRPVF